MRTITSMLLALGLLGCASNSGIIAIGDGNYITTKQAATGFPGTGKIKADALQEANRYCASQGKGLEVVKPHENEGPNVLGEYPRVELNFKCADSA